MKFIKKNEDGNLYWYFKKGFISKLLNDYVPEGVKPQWEYWIFKWKRKNEIGNKIIDNVFTLKEAKEIAIKLCK